MVAEQRVPEPGNPTQNYIIVRRAVQERAGVKNADGENGRMGGVVWLEGCGPAGLKGVVVGEGDTHEEALADVNSAIAFCVETFGEEVLGDVRSDHPRSE